MKGGDEAEDLMKFDYEIQQEQDPIATTKDGNQMVNFYFGFGIPDEQQVRYSDIDYGDSNDLQSIHSGEKGNTRLPIMPSIW